MKPYPKIETLYERDADFSITDVLKRPVLASISEWLVTEKIDGMNIRVDVRPNEHGDCVRFAGRSDNAEIPTDLMEYLERTFTLEQLVDLRRSGDDGMAITLYGEGYGAGIQKGGSYSNDKRFILFDVLLGDEWWMTDEVVSEFAARLGIARVPILGTYTLRAIRAIVRRGFHSIIAPTRMAEGIVARTLEPLFDRRGQRLIIKLKTDDWKGK